MLAKDDPCIDRLRAAVPEFEATFQTVAADEDDKLGSFQAVSAFAEFVSLRAQAGDWELVHRATDAVEWLLADDAAERQLARELAVEFLEAVADEAVVVTRLGPLGRQWQTVH